ncbi:hypothetical protein T492DRAFT_995225 [Pavlovales sp. CCMP2436]|nr:hypothetical protein T492DRAFT_995225 [Pavlovales sp. CCMP2436]
MDDATAAAYIEGLEASGPLGGRGGLGLAAGAGPQEKRKVSKAEKALLGTVKGRSGGLASMQTTVARAITHGNVNFDPWKKPVKTSELNNANTNKNDLYAHFRSAGDLTGKEKDTPAADASAAAAPVVEDKTVQKTLKKLLKASGGEMSSSRLRKGAVESLLSGVKVSSEAKAALKSQFGRALERGVKKGTLCETSGLVSLAKRKRSE